MELVSIIIPVYNASRFLDETIKSVRSQTYEKWELIFVDDCSTDNSEQIIKEYMKLDKRIKYFKQERNSGPAIARNRGIDEAKGRFLCFLDADDFWDKNKIEEQLNFMLKEDIAFSYTSYCFTLPDGTKTNKKVIAKKELKYKEVLKNNIISTITVMFNLKLIDKELIKMPNLKYVEDTATWFKILRHGFVAYGMPNIFSYYRRSSNTESSNKLKTQKSLWKLYRKNERLSIPKTIITLISKNFNALKRRI